MKLPPPFIKRKKIGVEYDKRKIKKTFKTKELGKEKKHLF